MRTEPITNLLQYLSAFSWEWDFPVIGSYLLSDLGLLSSVLANIATNKAYNKTSKYIGDNDVKQIFNV